jgi:hypothetical protein
MGRDPAVPTQPDRAKARREWVDVISKMVIAGVGVYLAFLANDYQQKTSVVTLLSQRETAESQLRSSMLEHLIGPFVGSAATGKPLDSKRAGVLLDLLALNFHTHFELKPLLLKVDADLDRENAPEQRRALQSAVRRIVDRQIAMLMAASAEHRGSWFQRLVTTTPSPAQQINLYFASSSKEPDKSDVTLVAYTPDMGVPLPKQGGNESVNRLDNPALFGGGSSHGVCSVSPNGTYSLKVLVLDFDPDRTSARVAWRLSSTPDACSKAVVGDDPGWRDVNTSAFTITPYDFPLTDNTHIDTGQRFALNLYYVDPEPYEDWLHILQIKLVWFPGGYITERERPMNYYQVNRTLGFQ